MSISCSRKGFVAIEPPVFNKIEARVESGLVRAETRVKVLKAALVMDYNDGIKLFSAGAAWHAILPGDSGLKPWARSRMEIDGKEFCLVPETEIIGFWQPDGGAPSVARS